MSSLAGHLWSTTLLLVALLAVSVVLVALRRGPAANPSLMRLVARLPLDPRRAVYLVQIGEKVLVLGASEGGLSRLGELEAKDLPLTSTDTVWHEPYVARWLAKRVPSAPGSGAPLERSQGDAP